MRFLVDAQLPRRLARWLSAQGHDALHTLDLPGKNATTDAEIVANAAAENRAVISSDMLNALPRETPAMKLEFRVKGSSDFPYLVAFSRVGDKLTARCSCFAGQSRIACKHVAEIVTGDAKRIVSTNKDDVAKVVAWFAGSTAEARL